ncbi:carboxypeptidase-like regulatory domain-containing protein [Conexibacter arvalis]|uniref:Uncharacterized protein n=1 Tax=Conexibacter arvalis TaxID=912552 RepID=A0A840IHR7_9ACTN|nr:carboxypeptidase-like regulatory domain-containing protein [Conexibacter arvalis]MBB4663761.1 hypothetical protein [Conexibacter arvalis]
MAGGAIAAAPAAAAGDQRYDVWSCRDPLGGPIGTSAWTVGAVGAASGDVLVRDDCAGGGALELALAPGRSFDAGVRGMASIVPPAGAHVDAWHVDYVAETAASGYEAAVGTRKGTAVQNTWGCLATGAPPCALGTDAEPERTGEGGTPVLHAIDLWAGCVAGPCAPASAPARLRLLGSRIQIHDLRAPAAPQLSGPVVEEPSVTGRATLVVESSDVGGGVAETTVSVDGGLPQVSASAGPAGTCREPFTVLQPCPSSTARAFTIDTTALENGTHTVAGTVVDAARNTTSWGPVAFEVKHPPRDGDRSDGDRRDGDVTPPPDQEPPDTTPPAGNGTPAVRSPRLRLARAHVVRKPGRAAKLTGTLRTRAGQPIAGARLTVVSQALGAVAARPRRLPAVKTTAAGRFAVKVKGRGAVRVTVSFAPRAGAADTVRAAATIRDRASLTIARSKARLRRNQAVVLRGRLRGAGAAARGAVVELQAIVSGEWRTVGTVRADRRGRYAWRYRFVSVTRDTIFTFRSLVRNTPGWPWPELRSRRLHVRVDAID